MKKSFLVLALITCFTAKVNAQDNNMFNHLSVGVSAGVLDGFGFEVATPIGNYVNLRAGYSFMPFKYTVDGTKVYKWVEATEESKFLQETDVELKLRNNTFKLLFDIHPSVKSAFRFTVGAYIGNSRFVSAVNTDPVADYADCFIKLGEKRFGFDGEYAHAHIKVNNFRPYLGVGFGRAIGTKSKSAFNFDLGVQFWGSPEVYGYDIVDDEYKKLEDADIDDAEGKKALKTLSKISICPVISVRYMFNIF